MPKTIFCLYIEATEEQAAVFTEHLKALEVAFYDATAADTLTASCTTLEDVECWIEGK